MRTTASASSNMDHPGTQLAKSMLGASELPPGALERWWRPEIVLTAAHCVMDPWHKTPFPLHDIHFLAGVRGAGNKGHAQRLGAYTFRRTMNL